MTTPNSLTEKLTSTVEVLIRERLNVLAAVLASNGASTEEQHSLLDQLVLTMREAKLVPQVIDSKGNSLPVDLEYVDDDPTKKPVLVFNEPMLRSVGEISDDMLIDTLAKPIAKLLGLPAATLAIILHERDEERLHELAVKLVGTVDSEVINFTALRSVQSFLLRRFFKRIAKISKILSAGLDVEVVPITFKGMRELLNHIATFTRWPSWEEVRGEEESDLTQPYAQPLNQVVQLTCQALSQTPWLQHAIKIIRIIWNCSDLAQRSFLVEAGRKLRSMEVAAPANVLIAIAEAVGSDSKDLSLRLEDWPRFDDLQSAMERLYMEESTIFGSASEHKKYRKPVSVVDIASRAFGISEPEELPWAMPLLCWTQRETDALRDLYLGKCKTTYGTSARSSCERNYDFSWHGTGDEGLVPDLLEKLPSVQVVPVGTNDIQGIADALAVGDLPNDSSASDKSKNLGLALTPVERCWRAAFKTLKDRFSELDNDNKDLCVEQMHLFYDKISPQMEESWKRRFEPLLAGNGSKNRAFSVLSRELADVIGKPYLIDPFESVENAQLLEKPRLVVISTIIKQNKVAVVWLPLALLSVTKTIGPIIIRIVEEREDEDPNKDSQYAWLRDIPIHIDFFSGQPKDVVFQCVYGDSLQIVLTI